MWHAVDHTADALLVVEAPSWPELLTEAVTAFHGWISAGAALPGEREERTLVVDGTDATETWVSLWRSLHRLWVVEGRFAVAARVPRNTALTHGEVNVQCVPATDVSPSQLVDVKAVTWHQASAGPTDPADPGGPWRGTIVLDI